MAFILILVMVLVAGALHHFDDSIEEQRADGTTDRHDHE